MEGIRVIEVKKRVFEGNERRAADLRGALRRQGTFLLNLMSSPGSGKTTTIMRTLERLDRGIRVGVLEADLDSDVDARTVATLGVPVVQLHSGGMCHLDAEMAGRGLEALGMGGFDLVILENIGNLICTAQFDTGASMNAMIISVPEGDDKPLKYPPMFAAVDAVVVNKVDAAEHFDFDLDRFRERLATLSPKAAVFPLSAKTGEGVQPWVDWLSARVAAWKR
jgi:hydrogenase nickel incorporation protein HypB